jgi:uncharacterized membrane protein YecN with MAPEG domain
MTAFTEPFHVFALYAALNALIMLILGLLVSRARIKTQTDIGDGGKPEMAAPLRAHGNNTEYVPMALLLMWALTPLTGAVWLIHAVGAPLTIGRILHAIGLSRSAGPSVLRFTGMILTWIAFVIGIVALFWLSFASAIPGA